MSEFSELVKHFSKVRSYVRDFYIYGFKSRTDYQEKSSRTYDNERRRIESWFSDYIRYDYNSARKKAVAITLDSNRIASNPLYNVWKSKSFTANDIMLHFFLLDFMNDGTYRNIDTITDELMERYQVLFDAQTVRKKLIEYADTGLIQIKKEGRQHLYAANYPMINHHSSLLPGLTDAICYFQAAAPFGFIGSTILDSFRCQNTIFRFRHDYLVHTLEDEMLHPILEAIQAQQKITLEIKSTKNGQLREVVCTPLKILVSTQTGRRYLCVRKHATQRLASYRLDSIQKVTPLDADPNFNHCLTVFEKNIPYSWGVSFGRSREPEQICMRIALDETTEGYIIDRLIREGRNGHVNRLESGVYEYTAKCWDCAEMLPWVKTFTGRIISFSCSNVGVENRFWNDMHKMQRMYLDQISD